MDNSSFPYMPFRAQTCHRQGNGGVGSFLPSGSILCPTRVSAQVNLEVGVNFCLPPAVLYWAPYWPVRFGKRDDIDSGVCLWWGVVPLGTPTNPIMVLVVCRKWPCIQVRRALRVSNQLSLLHSVLRDLPGHLFIICGLQVPARNGLSYVKLFQ